VKPIACVFLFCALIVHGLAGAASAQESGPPVVPQSAGQPAPHVDDLVAIALARSAELGVMRARLDAARELVTSSGALPDPMASVTYTEADFPSFSIGREPMSALTIEYRQSLPAGGKRDARRAASEADAETKARELEDVRRTLAGEVRTIYARVYALDRQRALLTAAHELLDMLASTAASRYSVGDAPQEPVIKAQIEASHADERLDDLAAERRIQVAALNRLLDVLIDTPLGTIDSLPSVTAPPGSWIDLAVANSSGLAVQRAEIDVAEKRLAVARLDLKPDFSVGGAVGIRGALPPVVTFGVGVELPFWKKEKQEPLVRAAEQELNAARRAEHSVQVELGADVARLGAEWQRAEQQIRRYQEAILPQTAAAMDAARLAYLNGRGDFSAVIEDFRLWLDARVRLVQREADRFTTWAELQVVIGAPAAPSAEGGH
jgi:outer membrane protein TolC